MDNMDRKNFVDRVFNELPSTILCSNFLRCTFNVGAHFERCNLTACTFNVESTFDRSNIEAEEPVFETSQEDSTETENN